MKTVLCLGATRLYAEGAASLLERFSDGAVRAVGLTPCDACSMSRTADLLLVDLPVSRGLDLVCRMRGARPELQVIALVDPALEEEVLGYARAGVMGYFTHDWPPSQMVAALVDGGPYAAGAIATILLRQIAHSAAHEVPKCSGGMHLTPREMQVLELIGKGLSNKEIARVLRVELATVKNHVHQILSKTRVQRRAQAVLMLRN
jgi:two-component system, NarL family, nitrate/nitrite response regulator NarL